MNQYAGILKRGLTMNKQLFSKITDIFNNRKTKEVYILLDVDGVLNFEGTPTNDNFTIISHDLGKWTIRDEVIEWLKRLVRNPKLKIYWISTWGNDSNIINRYLSIPEFETLGSSKGVLVETKLQAILNVVTCLRNKTVIVIDDLFKGDFTTSPSMSINETERTIAQWRAIELTCKENSVDICYIAPNQEVGLIAEDIQFIDKLLERNN